MKTIRSYRTLFLIISLLVVRQAIAQTSRYTPKEIQPPARIAVRVQITEGPSLELYRNNEAIIRWTSNNPGGTDEHWGVVKYGVHPDQLTLTAKGHIRLNREHPYTVFRVRLPGLQPGATYYYTVDSMGADGTDDGVKDKVHPLILRGGA